MLHFLQPAATLFIGMALSIYGLIQSLLHRPPTSAFHAAARAMPDAVAVFIFGFGIAAVIAGLILLATGLKGVRRRTKEINRVYGLRPPSRLRSSRDEGEVEWDRELYPSYRQP